MKKFFVIVPTILALGGCLQAGKDPITACGEMSAECLQATLAETAATPSAAAVTGETNRDGGDDARSGARAGMDAASRAGIAGGDEAGARDKDDARGDDDAGENDDANENDGDAKGNNGNKGNNGKRGDHRNQNAIDKGDNRFDGAGNADDARR